MFSTHRRLSFFSGLFVSDKYYTRKLRKWFGGLLHPLKSLVVSVIWLALIDAIYSRIAPLQLLFPKLLLFPPKRWMNFQTGSVRYCINKIFELTKSFIWEFQNGCNKVVIEPRVVQFWSEIILVISNRTRAARSFDFEITQMISTQIALHSVQLPLLITKRSNC